MNFSSLIDRLLTEAIEELDLAEDTGLELTEIRDLARLQGAMDRLGKDHPHYDRLASLHARKSQIEERKAEKNAKMHAMAKAYGYRRTSRKKKGEPVEYVHQETGHRLTIHPNNTWNHLQSGRKRTTQGISPLRHLRQHLNRLHA